MTIHCIYNCFFNKKVVGKIILPHIFLMLSMRVGKKTKVPMETLGGKKNQPPFECQYYV